MEGKNAAIVCDEGRFDALSRMAQEAGLVPFRADVEKAASAAGAGDCVLVLSDRPRAELEDLRASYVVVGEDGRLSLRCEAAALSAFGGLSCAAHAVAWRFSELVARQEDIRKQQARISDFLTGLQDAHAPEELVCELVRLREGSANYADTLERAEEALMEIRERIDELLRLAAEQEADRPKQV